VGVWMSGRTRLVAEIGRRFNEALKSGEYDHLFAPASSS
jgi:hypothetical protein